MVKSIILAEIFLTNQLQSKVRPILIIKQNSYGDFIFLPLTTNLNHQGILLNSHDFDLGQLPIVSKVIIEKVATIHKDMIIKEIAKLSDKKFDKIIDEFINFIKINP
jgi:mRNA-degrading endonuclease toxin of MazEF toxin-antitoxin module